MGWTITAAVVAAAVLYGLHRIAAWAEGRGWIYYRDPDRPRSAGLDFIAPIYHPATEHVIEETASFRARGDQADSGAGRPEGSEDEHRS